MFVVFTVVDFILWKRGILNNRLFYNTMSVTLPIIWIAFAGWYLSAPRIGKNWGRTTLLVFIFLPALFIMAFFNGLSHGERVLSNELPSKTIVMEDRTINVQVVLTLDRYFMLKSEADKQLLIVQQTESLK